MKPRCAPGAGAQCINMAVCERWGVANFFADGPSAGLLDVMPEDRKSATLSRNPGLTAVAVTCGPLGDILALTGASRFDLFSLDIEQSELFAVDTMAWATFPVHVLVMERDERYLSSATEKIDRILVEAGFKYWGQQRGNMVFVNPANARTEAEWQTLSTTPNLVS